jgi:hypothetical protein
MEEPSIWIGTEKNNGINLENPVSKLFKARSSEILSRSAN